MTLCKSRLDIELQEGDQRNEDTIFRRVERMEQGQMGGFASYLATAWFHADSHNRLKLEATWPSLFTGE